MGETVRQFIVNTGNVRRCNHPCSSSDKSTWAEVSKGLTCALESCSAKAGILQCSHEVICHPKHQEKVDPADRARREITVKLFLLDSSTPRFLNETVSAVNEALGVQAIDSFLLAVPPLQKENELLSPEFLQLWQAVDEIKKSGLIASAGVCDLSGAQLKQLVTESHVLPADVQVAYDPSSCCEALKDIREAAAQLNVRIITHSDSGDVVAPDSFRALASKHLGAAPWRPTWVARYTVVDTERSVITNLGYVVAGTL
eukprot:m.235168 g.235168  ORF g.235168 m.235168 type:complete len:257 (-) comp12779_c0_seq1:159-929(-)